MNRIYYKFFDTDIYGDAEYDIRGDELRALFDKCFEYCEFLSLDFTCLSYTYSRIPYEDVINDPHIKQLNAFRITMPNGVIRYREDIKYDIEGNYLSVRYYRLCPELKELLLSMVNGIFDFLNVRDGIIPEDPIFYRSDGSIFMFSEIHEGQVVLIPRDGEDISDIVSNELWLLNPSHRYLGQPQPWYFDPPSKNDYSEAEDD